MVGDAGDEEDPAGGPARAVARRRRRRRRRRDQGEPERSSARSAAAPAEPRRRAWPCPEDRPSRAVAQAGRVAGPGSSMGGGVYAPRMEDSLTLPGFVNAHTHTFQRALRGRAGGGDFWAWRELMLAEAERPDSRARPDELRGGVRGDARCGLHRGRRVPLPRRRRSRTLRPRRLSRPESSSSSCSRRTRAAGFRGCGRNRWRGICEISKSCATRGSASASPPTPFVPARADWLEELGRYAAAEELPLHVHADEQPREIEECVAEHGCRPIELLERTGCLGPLTTVVHATHADGAELDLLAESGATICACPTTEADLGDGFLPGSADRAPPDLALHRLRLEHPDRPARGAARARRNRAPADGPPRRVRHRAAALLRRGRGRSLARARVVARDRDRSRPPFACRGRPGGCVRCARRRVCRRRDSP